MISYEPLMTPDLPHDLAEDIAARESARSSSSAAAAGSSLTRWLAERELKKLPPVGSPTYERCQEKDCWGKANWGCPHCHGKACSAHRAGHHCSLPYLPR